MNSKTSEILSIAYDEDAFIAPGMPMPKFAHSFIDEAWDGDLYWFAEVTYKGVHYCGEGATFEDAMEDAVLFAMFH